MLIFNGNNEYYVPNSDRNVSIRITHIAVSQQPKLVWNGISRWPHKKHTHTHTFTKAHTNTGQPKILINKYDHREFPANKRFSGVYCCNWSVCGGCGWPYECIRREIQKKTSPPIRLTKHLAPFLLFARLDYSQFACGHHERHFGIIVLRTHNTMGGGHLICKYYRDYFIIVRERLFFFFCTHFSLSLS